jgi:hypothetical protein
MEFFRQGFYLDPGHERGLHWRLALLWYAKWPWLLLAVADVVRSRRHTYVVTSKAGARTRYWSFVLTHVALALVIFVVWHAGALLHRHPSPIIAGAAGILLGTSLLLAATELRGFPPPFDIRLWRPVPDPASRAGSGE